MKLQHAWSRVTYYTVGFCLELKLSTIICHYTSKQIQKCIVKQDHATALTIKYVHAIDQTHAGSLLVKTEEEILLVRAQKIHEHRTQKTNMRDKGFNLTHLQDAVLFAKRLCMRRILQMQPENVEIYQTYTTFKFYKITSNLFTNSYKLGFTKNFTNS